MKKEEKKTLVSYSKARLEQNVDVGMRGVDPMDIRPPQILLLQKSSDLSQFIDGKGRQAKVGQFFHTGKNQIYDSFECYFLFAAKSKYVSKQKPQEGEKDQYKSIGVMADDLTLFAQVFRSTALYTLSRLFSSVKTQRRPMYSFLVKIETKELSGELGTWFVPVLRILGKEADVNKLLILEEQAKALDLRTEEMSSDDFGNVSEIVKKEADLI